MRPPRPTVHVARHGTAGYCNVVSWSAGPNNGTTVGVNCYSTTGAPQDAPLQRDLPHQPGCHRPAPCPPAVPRAPRPGCCPTARPTRTPSRDFQFNSAGGTNAVTKLSSGFYRVDFPDLGTAGGIVHVNAYSKQGLLQGPFVGTGRDDPGGLCLLFRAAPASPWTRRSASCSTRRNRVGATFNAGYTRSLIPIASAAVTPPAAYSWNGNCSTNTVLRTGVGNTG